MQGARRAPFLYVDLWNWSLRQAGLSDPKATLIVVKALNKANLTALGAEVLAADDGPEIVTADLRKRFAAIRRGKSYLNRPAQKKLVQALIETRIAPTAPGRAF